MKWPWQFGEPTPCVVTYSWKKKYNDLWNKHLEKIQWTEHYRRRNRELTLQLQQTNKAIIRRNATIKRLKGKLKREACSK